MIAQTNFSLDFRIAYSSSASLFEMQSFKENNDCLILGSQIDYIVVGDLDKPAFKISHLQKMSKSELEAKIQNLGLPLYISTKAELISELMDMDKRGYYSALYENTQWHSLPHDFVCTGYSQGDVAKVLVTDQGFEYITEKYMQNLLFDNPIHGQINLDYADTRLVELYVDEFIEPYSLYDKNNLISAIKDQYTGLYKEALFEQLDQLPDSLNYC